MRIRGFNEQHRHFTPKDRETRRNLNRFLLNLFLFGPPVLGGAEAVVIATSQARPAIEALIDPLPEGILRESDLARKLIEDIENHRRVTADLRIIKSLVYHSQIFYGVDKQIAAERLSQISLNSDSCNDVAACIEPGKDKHTLVINPGPIDALNSQHDVPAQVMLVHIAAHESWHNATNQENKDDIIKLGPLGSYRRVDSRGFGNYEALDQSTIDFMNVNTKVSSNSGDWMYERICPIEEASAEFAAGQYEKHLFADYAGKSNQLDLYLRNFGTNIGYPVFGQVIFDLTYDSQPSGSWQNWWEGVLSLETLKRLHYNQDTTGLLLAVGEEMKRRNKTHPYLSTENTLGLGLLALEAFLFTKFGVGSPEKAHPVFLRLQTLPITPESLQATAKELQNFIATMPYGPGGN